MIIVRSLKVKRLTICSVVFKPQNWTLHVDSSASIQMETLTHLTKLSVLCKLRSIERKAIAFDNSIETPLIFKQAAVEAVVVVEVLAEEEDLEEEVAKMAEAAEDEAEDVAEAE